MVRHLLHLRRLRQWTVVATLLLGLAPACNARQDRGDAGPPADGTSMPSVTFGPARRTAQQLADTRPPTRASERDDIFTLLAYAIARSDWQSENAHPLRGHNIAAVLVDRQQQPVSWARNTVFASADSTRHAEVRVMECYLARADRSNLDGFTLYTTLEPCAMCTGMMLLARLPRVVFGENDPSFGDAAERLSLDSRRSGGGYAPYPFEVRAEAAGLYHRYWLEQLFDEYRQNHRIARISEFLTTPQTRTVFDDATTRLQRFSARFAENEEVLQRARRFYADLDDTAACPSS